MAPKLELAFTMRSYVSVQQTLILGAVKGDLRRSITPITHGYIKGSGLDATVLPGGGDVALVRAPTSHLPPHNKQTSVFVVTTLTTLLLRPSSIPPPTSPISTSAPTLAPRTARASTSITSAL